MLDCFDVSEIEGMGRIIWASQYSIMLLNVEGTPLANWSALSGALR